MLSRTECGTACRYSRLDRALWLFLIFGVLAALAADGASSGKGRKGPKVVKAIKHNFAFTVLKPERLPFKLGERLRYEYSWFGISAATTTARFKEGQYAGKKALRVETSTRTSRGISKLWSMNEYAYSLLECDTYRPMLAYQFTREGEKVTRKTTAFDFDTHVAKNVKWRLNPKPKTSEYEIHFENGRDPVSLFYMLRCLPQQKGAHACFEVVTGGNIYAFEVRLLGFEKVTVPAGRFSSAKFECDIHRLTPGKKKKKKKYKKITAWVSTGPARLPLKLVASVFVGRVSIKLTGYKLGE